MSTHLHPPRPASPPSYASSVASVSTVDTEPATTPAIVPTAALLAGMRDARRDMLDNLCAQLSALVAMADATAPPGVPGRVKLLWGAGPTERLELGHADVARLRAHPDELLGALHRLVHDGRAPPAAGAGAFAIDFLAPLALRAPGARPPPRKKQRKKEAAAAAPDTYRALVRLCEAAEASQAAGGPQDHIWRLMWEQLGANPYLAAVFAAAGLTDHVRACARMPPAAPPKLTKGRASAFADQLQKAVRSGDAPVRTASVFDHFAAREDIYRPDAMRVLAERGGGSAAALTGFGKMYDDIMAIMRAGSEKADGGDGGAGGAD